MAAPWQWQCDRNGTRDRLIARFVSHDETVLCAAPCGYTNSSVEVNDADAVHIARMDPPTTLAVVARVRELEIALREACDVAQYWIPNAGVERAQWSGARARIAELRKLVP